MKAGRATPGKSRICPLCRETILESVSVCPACRHHLRYDPNEEVAPRPTFCPFRVEGTVRHDGEGEPWEYSVVLEIRDDKGERIGRHTVGVGALSPSQARTFALAVEVLPSDAALDRRATADRTPVS